MDGETPLLDSRTKFFKRSHFQYEDSIIPEIRPCSQQKLFPYIANVFYPTETLFRSA